MTEQNFEHMRRAMIASQLRTTGTNDPRVLAAMGEVPRERFVPRDRLPLAYADALVPLKPGRDLNPPMALGRLLTQAAPREGEKALADRRRHRLFGGGAGAAGRLAGRGRGGSRAGGAGEARRSPERR